MNSGGGGNDKEFEKSIEKKKNHRQIETELELVTRKIISPTRDLTEETLLEQFRLLKVNHQPTGN